ncbi:hypothetical protein [Streptococcus canis]|uniref:hypothetical protein n=1 Tax=Streptococcus canis TaxID=1329 RepID=UPI00114458F9|nr:hypothetical protein [Streptococcus canis]QKG76883.1 hypothetical protein GE021_001310 [Streptococcus canis]GEE06490.1 hypothetical protein ScOT1_05830 [Streptococcus canis]GFG41157.1 hypothetical protein ScFU29_00620 [Streptococcus canis]GMX35327.1 hypothetical protein SpKU43_04050 [Streptococcus canis]GMX39200.1 hypothetical protein ScKU71_04230 [Streptococcus canis]
MKKVILVLTIVSLAIGGLVVHNTRISKHVTADSISDGAVISKNYTLSKMREEWKDSTRTEFDRYFNDLSDDVRILASNEGGISFFDDNIGIPEDGNIGTEQQVDGTVRHLNIKGSESTTVGEVRKMMHKILK